MNTISSAFKTFYKSSQAFAISLALLVGVVAPVFLHGSSATALSGSSFQAGHIIDDGIFTDSTALSVQDIQNFLNAKVGTCDDNGTQPSDHWNSATNSYYTDGQWSALNGQSSTFTCINQFVENTTTLQNNYGNYQESVPGGISAAQIIWNAAQDYQINPEVILATLQKEQGLVTDYWPWIGEYTAAMGYSCPDTGSCSGTYADFYKQVDSAAWQFRHYLTDPNDYNFTVGQDYIQYNTNNATCGGTVVNIQNEATAALYDYTPYQPNAAALANLTGTGDSCSSYGNRNFWYYFNTWFGDSLSSGYQAANESQSTALSLYPGQTGTMTFEFRNTGENNWYDDDSIVAGAYPIHLATANPVNSNGYFTGGWPTPQRPALTFSAVYESDGVTLDANQHVVQPGEIGVFTFPVTIPNGTAPGVYQQYVTPVAEGAPYWNMGAEAETNITVLNPLGAKVLTITNDGIETVQQNSTTPVAVTIQNTGENTWYDDDSVAANNFPLHLATSGPVNRNSVFDSSWPLPSRPDLTFSAVYDSDGVTLAPNQHEVTPGEIAKYDFNLQAPVNLPPGTYQEIFQPVFDGSQNWNMGAAFVLQVNVQSSTFAAQYYGQSNALTLAHNATGSGFMKYQNVGTGTWYDDDSALPGEFAVHLATDIPINRTSTTEYEWPTPQRPDLTFSKVYDSDGVTLAPNQHEVTPGEIAEFDFQFINNSLTSGQSVHEWFTPVLDGAPNWSMTNQDVGINITGQ